MATAGHLTPARPCVCVRVCVCARGAAGVVPVEESERLAQLHDQRAVEEVVGRAADLDESEGSCLEHVPALGAMGLMGLNLPIEYGGPGATPAAWPCWAASGS